MARRSVCSSMTAGLLRAPIKSKTRYALLLLRSPMQRIVWFAISLLILSCSLDTNNLTGGTGTGGAVGTGGTTSTGGQRGDGGSATGGQVGTGGSATGGQIGAGGETGGQTGTGGSATGGQTGTGGNKGTGGGTCQQLAMDYVNALPAAKDCTYGVTGQCQQLVASSLSCGCQVYVNDATTLNA